MPVIVPGLDQVVKPVNCRDRGGIRAFYWTEWSNVDFDNMLSDPLLFDPANQLILGYAMNNDAIFNKVEFERKEAFYDFNYTEEQDFFTLLLTLGFKGKDYERRNALDKALGVCAIYGHIYGNGGEQRAIGIDYNGEVFDPIVKELKVTRYNDAGGQLGTSRSSDTIDIGGESFRAPLFATVSETAIPITAPTAMETAEAPATEEIKASTDTSEEDAKGTKGRKSSGK